MKTTTAPETVSSEAVSPPAAFSQPEKTASLVTSTLVVLSLGHFAVDFYSSSVSTLQPVLVERYGLSLTQAGVIGGVFMLASAVAQLFFGLVSDRLHSRLFVVAGLATAGIFLSSMGLAAGFKSLLLLIFVGGLGVASFHPQSTSQVTTSAGRRKGLAVAIFITSGMAGLSLGPTFFSSLTGWLGIESLYVAALPALVIAAVLLRLMPPPSPSEPSRRVDFSAFWGQWKPLLLHYALVVLRSIVHLAIAQFLTLYLYTERAFTLQQASFALTLFFVSSALASLIGGSLADRIGGRRVVLISMIACIPFLALFLGTTGWLSLLGLFAGGLILLLTNPVIVLMAQELVPTQAGTASALMMGFGWGMAGITFIPFIGWLADRIGLEAVLWGVIGLPLLGFLLALKLPAPNAERMHP